MAQVLSVNAGKVLDAPWAGLGRTAMDKRPVSGVVRAHRLGLEGDQVGDTQFHGGVDQAVYAFAREDLDWWAGELGREIRNGQFAENLTTRGIDVNEAEVGERWQVGTATFEIAMVRIPCNDFNEMIAPAFAGKPGGLSRDDVLDNITLYWLTGTAISSARLYWENKLDFFDVKGITIPTGVSAFPHELYCAPRSWSEKAYPKLVYYKQHDVGGHFAAWEQPQLFCEDVRATFRSVRTV